MMETGAIMAGGPPLRYPLSLHHLTALDASAEALIAIAAGLHCDHVCLFTHVPARLKALFPEVATEAQARTLARHLGDNGMSACTIDFFPIEPDIGVDTFIPGLARGALLGARHATTQIHDPDAARAADAFARLSEIAAGYGIRIGLEFTGMSVIDTIGRAGEFLATSGVGGAGLVVDPLHLYRTGGSAEQVAVQAKHISYAQLCGGTAGPRQADYRQEAVGDRLVPGSGDFALTEFVGALPPAVPISIEVPQNRLRASGVPAAERARMAVAGARQVIAATDARIPACAD